MYAILEYLRKMKYSWLVFSITWLFTSPVHSQFTADFSNGTLDVWQGDKSNFIVNPGAQLQLNAPSGSTTSWLYTPVTYIDSMVWEVYFKMDFAPSTSNQLRLYLGVDGTDLTGASGYYLEIGASGDQDPIDLKYLDHGVSSTIATSAAGIAGAEPVEFTLRITRHDDGSWQCYSLGDVVPELLFATSHDLLPLSGLSYFGMYCKYTDTRRDKFYFDNISIQPIMPDVTAPQWVELDLIDGHTVTVAFDEALDPASVQDPNHYILTPGNTHPDVITAGPAGATLTWNTAFTSLQEYTLHIDQVKDLAGNTMTASQKTFTYIQVDHALPNELLITEIMADPTPVIALPDAEYIEIYNASTGVVRLSDYRLRAGSSETVLPDILLFSHTYIIICDEDKSALLEGIGPVAPVANFPSLTNSGSTVLLKDADEIILHSVTYDLSWYHDPDKSDGGWALEMINPTHICSDKENWSAAQNLTGGTPGQINTQWNESPDEQGPSFISLFTAAPDQLHLSFSERMDEDIMENPSTYTILPATTIASVQFIQPTVAELTLAAPLQEGVIYTLIPFQMFDCLGNSSLLPDTIVFGLTSTPEPGDILVNEILFNPQSGGSRFVEVVNVSQKFISLNTLAIARLHGAQTEIYPVSVNETLAPGQLAVFSPDPSDVDFRYEVPAPNRMFTSTLPSWDEDRDNVTILSGSVILDSLTYSSDWHLPVIADQNGVSLERVSVMSPSTLSHTWHSASSVSGYATPTGVNSQNVAANAGEDGPYTITNRQFSPNEDGYKDFLALNFLLTSGEDIGTVSIYDLEGREIIELVSNESLGSEAIIQWDGRNGDHVVADMGIYIIFIELWDAEGHVREYQETCALVKR